MEYINAEHTGVEHTGVEHTGVGEGEVTTPEIADGEFPQVESPQAAKEQSVKEPSVSQEKKASDKELNFAALREEKSRLEQDHIEALKRLREYESSPKKEQVQEDLEINIGDDDLFEGKHYKKLQKQIKKQNEELQKYQQQVQLTATEAKLNSQYSDFSKVLNEENIKKLREQEPELAITISSTQDVYAKAVAAYKMIKKLGIYIDDNYDRERAVAQKNSLKPKPLASVSPQQGDSPLARANAFANGLTSDLKAQLWKEMNEASKNS